MKTIYKNFLLLDGTKNMTIQKDKYIIVNEDIIEYIGDELNLKESARIVDLGGRYLMPGLINLHVHLPASGKPEKKAKDKRGLVKLINTNSIVKKVGISLCRKHAKMHLMSGTTTIRSVGGICDIDTILKNEKELMPTIIASNQAIGVKNGHMDGTVAVSVENEKEAIDKVVELKNQGVDLIKLMITGGILDATKKGEPGVVKMPNELVKVATSKAHELNLQVSSHVESKEGVLIALKNGVDTIEHGSDLDEEMINLFKQNNSSFIATLSPAVFLVNINPSITGLNEMAQYNSKIVLEGMINGVKKCLENDIRVGLGTDTGCPYCTHYNMWRELECFKKYIKDDSTLILHLATLNNASILGLDNVLGSVEVNKKADFLIVDKNPLESFRALSNPYMVVKNGKEIKNIKIKKIKNIESELDKLM